MSLVYFFIFFLSSVFGLSLSGYRYFFPSLLLLLCATKKSLVLGLKQRKEEKERERERQSKSTVTTNWFPITGMFFCYWPPYHCHPSILFAVSACCVGCNVVACQCRECLAPRTFAKWKFFSLSFSWLQLMAMSRGITQRQRPWTTSWMSMAETTLFFILFI